MKRVSALLAALVATMPAARADYVIKDGNGVQQIIRSGNPSGIILPWMTPVDALGTALGTQTNPIVTSPGGSTGADFSANAPPVPSDTTFVLIATVPASLSRAMVGIQNQSQVNLQIVRDDGAGNNQTSIFLQGPFASWQSSSFKGRVRVYGPSGAAVAAYQD